MRVIRTNLRRTSYGPLSVSGNGELDLSSTVARPRRTFASDWTVASESCGRFRLGFSTYQVSDTASESVGASARARATLTARS